MIHSNDDAILGLATLIATAGLVTLTAGLGGLMYISILIAFGWLALHLWQRPSRLSKVLAACLVPALFWSHLMSKGPRQRIKDFEAANAQRAQRL